MRKKELKNILEDLFNEYEFYEDIINALRSLNTENEITNEEYDYILTNYESWLNEWLSKKDNKQHFIDNIDNTIKEIKEEVVSNASYDINGVYDNAFEENNDLINDIRLLIGNNEHKANILINVIGHYINQYYDTLKYQVDKTKYNS